MSIDEWRARECLGAPALFKDDVFAVFRYIAQCANDPRTLSLARELVIRALAIKVHIPKTYAELLDALVREVGLYPYADPTRTHDLADQMLIEAHRVTGLGEERVFHSLQLSVFRELMNGRNVVLSATTSVGKSLVIDAVLAAGKHRRAAIIVPTIALIDETRRRLIASLGTSHDIITHPSQRRLDDGRPTVYVLTQERALGRDDLDDIEFFVIDEFYKLDLRREDDDRAIDLNLCFHRLAESGAQFYLIGPNIASVAGLQSAYRHVFIPSDFATVALDVEYFNLKMKGPERGEKLAELCKSFKTPTLVYCQSPRSAREAAKIIYQDAGLPFCLETASAVNWLEERFPAEWEVIEALRYGVGIHHANVPRALQQYMIRAFEEKKLRFLACTSTIIEGVNTVAENVVIFDRRRHLSTIDDFTFRNIAGRAGRMNRYFIGKVYVLEQPVDEGLHEVDIPVGQQDEDTPVSLLLDLPDRSLVPESRDRLETLFAGSPLSEATIRANRQIPVETQNTLFRVIEQLYDRTDDSFQWTGIPRSHQLLMVCNLIYDHIDGGRSLRGHGIFAGDQLQAALTGLMHAKGFTEFLRERVEARWAKHSVSDAVEQALGFLRNYVGYHFGRHLMVVSRIQEEVLLKRFRVKPGDYSLLAAQADSLFLPPGLFALDEYGIPSDLSVKLAGDGTSPSDLDGALRMLARADPEREDLHPFERSLLADAKRALPARARIEVG